MRYKAHLTITSIALLSLVACFPDTGVPPATTTTAPPTTTPPDPVSTIAPLTGLNTGSTTNLDRPALAVKIDNTTPTYAPAGINSADIVVESLTEAAVTRFTAVFHSKNAAQVGPVRSVRATDAEMLAAFRKPLFANSGANTGVEALTNASPFLVNLSEPTQPQLYTRSGPNPAPHDLYSSTSALYGATPTGTPVPSAPFAFLGTGQLNPGIVASEGANIRFSASGGFGGAEIITWIYDAVSSRYLRTQGFADPHIGLPATIHRDTDGQQLWTNNLVILQVQQQASHGGLSPKTVGFGTGWVLNNRTAVEVNWSRASATSPFVFTARNGGGAVKVKPGRTYLELVSTQVPSDIFPG